MRITERDLQSVCDRINRTVGAPIAPYTRKGGVFSPNPGTYLISAAYGGYALHRMAPEGTGESDVFRSGHIARRDLYERMHAFLTGLETREPV